MQRYNRLLMYANIDAADVPENFHIFPPASMKLLLYALAE